ncbi:MAG: CarD family transcriptional regulator, partial [Mogibacterium diversum]|nr:CarD family transcriptional regulator [Mogibacterium diversum]
KKLLGNAKQILESELVLAGGLSLDEADSLVESNI